MLFLILTCTILTLNPLIHCANETEKTQICIKQGTKKLLQTADCWIIRNHITFQELIQQDAFVDKSLLIKEVISPHSSQKKLILAPHKWGKSLILDMVEFFVKVHIDENGNKIPKENTTAYRYFVHGEVISLDGKIQKLLQQPLISKQQKFTQTHLGNYAVIKLDLDRLSIGGIKPNFQKFWESFRQKISTIYQSYKYVLKKVAAVIQNINNKYNIEQVFRAEFEYQEFGIHLNLQSTKDDLPRSISFLCQILKKYVSNDVVILIDNYDIVFNEIYFNPRTNTEVIDEIQEILDFLNNFIKETFVANVDYYKGIVTGIHEVPKYISISKATVYNFLTGENDLTPYYGFTEPEFRQLLILRGVNNESYSTIMDYYGHRSLDHPVTLHFSPWAIMNFLHTQNLTDYWCKVGPFSKNIINVIPNFEVKLALEQLLNMDSYISLDKPFSDLRAKNVAFLVQTQLREDFYSREVKLILLWLSCLGYLSPSKNHQADFKSTNIYNVSISNMQVREFIGFHLKAYYRRLLDDDFQFLENAAHSMKLFLDSDKPRLEKFDQNIQLLLTLNGTVKRFKKEFYARGEMQIANHCREYTHIQEAAARSLMRKVFSLLQIENKITVDTACSNTIMERNFYENKFFAYHQKRSVIVHLVGNVIYINDLLSQTVNSTVPMKDRIRAFEIVKYVVIVVNRRGYVNIGTTLKDGKELKRLISRRN